MIPRTVAALTLAAIIAACDPTPTPTPAPTQGPIVARLALPYAGQWQRDGRGTASLLAYPEPPEPGATAGAGYP